MTSFDNDIHIWAIISRYNPNFSGAAIQAHRILTELANQGFTVTVLTPGNDDASYLRGKEIKRDVVSIRYISRIPSISWNFLAKFTMFYKIIYYFYGLLVKLSQEIIYGWIIWRNGKRNDIVQVYSIDEFSWIPTWLARLKGMHPVVQMNLLGSDDPGAIVERMRRGNIIVGLKLKTFHLAEAVIGLSTALTNSYRSVGLNPAKILRIPNGVDLQTFRPIKSDGRVALRKDLGFRVDRRYILFVGDALYRKGIDVLIKAFIRVTRQFDDVELIIIGRHKGGYQTDFMVLKNKQLVDGLKGELSRVGLASRVHWVGLVDNVDKYLQAVDIFCFPTRREGLPNVVAEAMALGLPVVLSRVEGITTDFFKSVDEGVLVTGYDPDDYASVFTKLLNNPSMAKAMGNAARLRVVSDFDLVHITRRYAQLYKGLAGVASI